MTKDVRGTWSFTQSNGPVVKMAIDRQFNNGSIDGNTATYDHPGGPISQDSGPIASSKVTDTQIIFRVNWSSGTHGQYTGTFDVDGNLTGIGHAVNNPASQATWVAHQTFTKQM
ncbi:hypothetical protein [Streptomyces sp. KR80]|uniref:hypothetical protein n=1 Tax=Streptomyces sp. KR80 TaxID=3457426 RepID=UPI003FD12272